MADPAAPNSNQPPAQEQPVAPAAAQPAPQEPVAAASPPETPAVLPAPAVIPEPAPAAPAADAKAVDPTAPVPSLLQEFDKDAAAKAKPADKPAEPAKDAATPKDGEKPKDEPAKDAAKPADAKPADAPKPDDAAKPAEAAKAAEPAKPEPVEYKYELPTALKMDDAQKGEVHALFDGFRADPVKGVQGLIDYHAKAMTDFATKFAADALKNQHDVFNETRKNWRTEVKADDEIGGAGYQTSMGAVARMRDLVASDMMTARKWDDGSPRASELDEFLMTTGAGDHPVFLKMMHRFARFFDEASPPPPNPQPLPNGGKKPASRMKDLYADGPQKSS